MSRIAVLSDVHANLAALNAVLHELACREIDAIWYLGDLVVYGPQPGECIDRMREVCERWPCVLVRGNNDDAVIQDFRNRDDRVRTGTSLLVEVGIIDPSDPDLDYVVATELSHAWTVRHLNAEQQDWLMQLTAADKHPHENVLLVHASPCDPVGVLGNYLHDVPHAEEAWLSLDQPICFFGHTHQSMVFEKVRDRLYDNTLRTLRPEGELKVGERPLLVNPGSVGQPRDGSSAAAYATYDTEEDVIAFYRVTYDVEATVQALEALQPELENLVVELNAASGADTNPYKPGDAATTVNLLKRRLLEAS